MRVQGMRKQRQLFAKTRMSGKQRKALIRSALLDYPIRQAAREQRRRDTREGLPIRKPKSQPYQYNLQFNRRQVRLGWLTIPG